MEFLILLEYVVIIIFIKKCLKISSLKSCDSCNQKREKSSIFLSVLQDKSELLIGLSSLQKVNNMFSVK